MLIFFLTLKNAGGGLPPTAIDVADVPRVSGAAAWPGDGAISVEQFGRAVDRAVDRWLVGGNLWLALGLLRQHPDQFYFVAADHVGYAARSRRREKTGSVSVDFIGLGAMSLGLSTLVWAVNNGTEWGWTSTHILSLFGIAAVSLVVLIFAELKTKHPVFDVRVFQNQSFTLSFLARLLNTAIFQSTNFVFGIFLQRELRFSPIQAGQRLVPMAITSGMGALSLACSPTRYGPPSVVALSVMAASITMYFYTGLDVGATLLHIVTLTAMQSFFRSGTQATMTTMGTGHAAAGANYFGRGYGHAGA
jgi:hypothetical protein